jgi:hypothetical protein
MSTKRLAIVSVAALAFVVMQTWIAYTEPDSPNCTWAVFAWFCLLFVAGLWWEVIRKK